MQDHDKEIEELEGKLIAVKVAKAKFEALTDAQKLGGLLHEQLCHRNHTDGCGYYHESWDNMGYTRNREIQRAKRVLIVFDGDFERAKGLVKALKD